MPVEIKFSLVETPRVLALCAKHPAHDRVSVLLVFNKITGKFYRIPGVSPDLGIQLTADGRIRLD
jgi:hypothetical protein